MPHLSLRLLLRGLAHRSFDAPFVTLHKLTGGEFWIWASLPTAELSWQRLKEGGSTCVIKGAQLTEVKPLMKVKKACKRLQRIEGLLAAIRDGCTKADERVQQLLDTAKAAVSDAMTRLQQHPSKKPPTRANEASSSRSVAPRRGRVSGVANKRVISTPKRRIPVNGRALRKTA